MKPSSVMIACSLLLFFIIGWPSAIAGKFSIFVSFPFVKLSCLLLLTCGHTWVPEGFSTLISQH